MSANDTYYAISPEETGRLLDTDKGCGLSSADAEKRLETWGMNSIPDSDKLRPFQILFRQLLNPMVYLLGLAAALSFVFSEWLDAVAILIVLVLNTIIGFSMELQAGRTMKALKEMVRTMAVVMRNGRLEKVDSELVVPGDILIFEAGDMIAADARIIEENQLQTNESALTGESLPVDKALTSLPGETTLAERLNMVYRGSFVTRGRGKAIVTNTGLHTQIGKIAKLVKSSTVKHTPLESKMSGFSKKMVLVTVVIVIILVVVGYLNDVHWKETIQVAIALAVAAIPEGLPIVTTLALAQGMLKMARQNVIVKRLSSVETLGSTNTICCDKTGTLTQNKIEVSLVDYPGASPADKGSTDDDMVPGENARNVVSTPALQRLYKIAVLCNDAEYIVSDEKKVGMGDPLEIALLQHADAQGIDIASLKNTYQRISEIPFNSSAKIMATCHYDGERYLTVVKGAIEEVLRFCTHTKIGDDLRPLTGAEKEKWLKIADQWGSDGLRVLAFAWKETDEKEEMLTDLAFAGIIGFLDPPAEGVKGAIRDCRDAGINVVMITGDHPSTALTIGNKTGLIDEKETLAVTGSQMSNYDQLSEEERQQWLSSRVFARVNPEQKLDLVRVLQEDGRVVCMTGDGVNDAPALKQADIGIAMGQRGSQVAQAAADMVLKDDAFTSIVTAVRQGRIIFDNIRKFVIYLLSSNLSELMIVTTIAIFNLPFQLYALQILFINLITDVFPALALGIGSGDDKVMEQPPKDIDEAIIQRKHWLSIVLYAIVISLFSIGCVLISHHYIHVSGDWDWSRSNNILFYSLIANQLIHVFNMDPSVGRSLKSVFFGNKYIWYALFICIGILAVSYLAVPVRQALHVQFLTWPDWLLIAGGGIASFSVIHLLKRLRLIRG